jgi:hypothetical protein
VAVALAAAVCVCAGSAGASRVRASGRVVFYTNLADSVPGLAYNRNTPRVRPKRVLMFADGSWVIEKLRWSSCGGAVARATGISSASTGVPNVATAPRIKDPAELVVSHPERLFGREVYGCYQLTVPSYPASDQHECLKRSYGKQYDYSPVAGSPFHLSDFLSPDSQIWCSLQSTQAWCGERVEDDGPQHSATLRPDGQLVTCDWKAGQGSGFCLQNFDSSADVLKAGQVDLMYQYRCQAAATAITCTVDTGAGKGKGFTIASTGVTPIP